MQRKTEKQVDLLSISPQRESLRLHFGHAYVSGGRRDILKSSAMHDVSQTPGYATRARHAISG